MIVLGGIEGREGHDFGNDWTRIDLGCGKLRDVGFGDLFLFVRGVEDRRAILRAGVRTLTVELRGVVDHGKIDHQKLAVGDLGRVVDDADGFGVSGDAQADRFVAGRFYKAAGISRGGRGYTFYMLEYALYAPEASAGK